MLISNVEKSITVKNSLDARFSKNVFEAVQKIRSTCFIGSKTTKKPSGFKPDKTLLLVSQTLREWINRRWPFAYKVISI